MNGFAVKMNLTFFFPSFVATGVFPGSGLAQLTIHLTSENSSLRNTTHFNSHILSAKVIKQFELVVWVTIDKKRETNNAKKVKNWTHIL